MKGVVHLKRVSGFLLYFYTLLLIYSMFIGFSGFSRIPSEEYKYNFIPFQTISLYFTYYDHFPLWTWLINLAGNIGVFVPFGLLLPTVFPKLQHLLSFLVVFMFCITILESLQLLLRLGSFDVDDILLNTIGALLGYLIFKIVKKRSNPRGSES